jgi:hypothetical protein
MIHPHTELRFISEAMGYGVFATRSIPKGTITWARDDFDQTFTAADVEQLRPEYRRILEKSAILILIGIGTTEAGGGLPKKSGTLAFTRC